MTRSIERLSVALLAVLSLTISLAWAEEEQNPEAIKHYNAGVELWRSGQMEKAIEEYQKSLALDSTNVQTLYGLGLVYRQLDQTDQAIGYLAKAVGINPRYIDAYYELGLAYWKKKSYEEAINQFTTVTNFGPESGSKYPKAYYSLGRIFLLQEQLDQSLEALQTAVAFDSKYVEAYFYLGEALREKKDLKAAIEAYRQAAALDSTDMQTWYRLGIVYKDDGQYEQAVGAYQRVMQSKSKFATDSRYRLAVVFNAMRRHQDAIDTIGEYLQRDPKAANALMVLGEAHENLGQYAQAIEAYTKASADSRWKQFANYKIEELKKYVEEE